jgi:hypothetical protein
VDQLCHYDRVTLRLWAHGHAHVAGPASPPPAQRPPAAAPPGPSGPPGPPAPRWLAQAAAHAVLAGLRRCASLTDLLARYETAPGDLALVRSLLPDAPAPDAPDPVDDPAWRVRDAAFYLRWQELLAAPAPGPGGGRRR